LGLFAARWLLKEVPVRRFDPAQRPINQKMVGTVLRSHISNKLMCYSVSISLKHFSQEVETQF
jgi:hypothetical protein